MDLIADHITKKLKHFLWKRKNETDLQIIKQ